MEKITEFEFLQAGAKLQDEMNKRVEEIGLDSLVVCYVPNPECLTEEAGSEDVPIRMGLGIHGAASLTPEQAIQLGMNLIQAAKTASEFKYNGFGMEKFKWEKGNGRKNNRL